MHRRDYTSRLYIILAVFLSILAFYAGRIIYLQVFKSPHLTQLAYNQHNILLEIAPERGDIFDRNMRRLAVDCKVDSIYAVPDTMPENIKPALAEKLSNILTINKGLLLNTLKQDRSFVWIKREVDKDISGAVVALGSDSIGIIKEHKRFYPNGNLASHLIGFAGVDDTGLEGIELSCNNYLKGSPGWRWTVRDAKRRDILSKDTKSIPPSDGLDVVLTIDEAIQHIAERELASACNKYNAKSGTVIVMDPADGAILALANRPTFDLNSFSSSSMDSRRNRALTDMYEPGSVFKIVTASCALEKGAFKADDEFFCEEGEYFVGGRILHDHKPLGKLTFSQVIEKSSNIGVTKIAQVLGKEEIFRFMKLFGFGELTGINMPGEVEGIVKSPDQWSGVSISAIPIGQEVAVTSLQLASALSVIANNGYLMKPRIVREIVDENSNIIKAFPPVKVRRVISETTATQMKDIMTKVVELGTGRRARLEKYTAAGKTGTAQKLKPGGGYSHDSFIASFIGFAPTTDPKIAIVVSIDDPRPVYYGGTVSAPVFKNIARDVLRYLKVEQDKEGSLNI